MNATTTLGQYFTVKERTDGTTYVTLADEHPEWLYEVCREMHDDEMPNDWRWAHCRFIAEAIDDGTTDASDIAESLTDTNTADLLAWVSGNLNRTALVDEMMSNGGEWKDLRRLLQAAQCEALYQMAQLMLDAIAENDEADEFEDYTDTPDDYEELQTP